MGCQQQSTCTFLTSEHFICSVTKPSVNMAEAVGFVIGGISLATLFDSCMNAFDHIEAASTYGREYQKSGLNFSLLQLRLSRWAEGVRTVNNSQPGFKLGTPKEAKAAQKLLGEIAADIEDTEAAAKRYTLEDDALPASQSDQHEMAMKALTSRVRSMALHRQKSSSFAQKTRWALRDQRKFRNLISDLDHHVTQLETLFPPVREIQPRLAATEASELVQPSEIEEPGESESAAVKILKEATSGVDKILEAAIEKAGANARRDHQFSDVNTLDRARAGVGDEVALGATPNGYGHTYRGMTAKDDARVLYGNNYGGKSVYDD